MAAGDDLSGRQGDGVAIVYATRDGQSERIAERIAAGLRARGAAPSMQRLTLAAAPTIDAERAVVAAVLAVRYGKVLKEGVQFLTAYARAKTPPPLALGVVNLVARDPTRRTVATNPYLRKSLERAGLRPALATAIGGRLNYPKYRFFDKHIIRLIMAMTGGVTDGRSDIEFTDWAQVDDFAAAIGALAEGRAEPGPFSFP